MLTNRWSLLAFTAVFGPLSIHSQAPATLSSPNGQIVMHFQTPLGTTSSSQDGKLVYSVQFREKNVLDNSALALELAEGPSLGSSVRITGAGASQGIDDYTLQFQKTSPVDRSIFPFTRLLAGPMDYTPGGFNNTSEDSFLAQNTSPTVMGTRAQQLALYVIFQTPIQMVSASPQAYAGQPAFQFIKDVPASWDRTRVLNGTPGEFVTIARQHGEEWYLGSMTSWTPRTLKVPLDFLPTGEFTAEIYADAMDSASHPKNVVVRKQTVTKNKSLTLTLAASGGCAIRFVPRRER